MNRKSPMAVEEYDTVIIGAGFFGLRIAQFLYDELGQKKILILEKESAVMTRASYNNQARVHNGYHYPRSLLTALRSRVNMPIFCKEYEDAIVDDFKKYYGVARHFSKVSARQFKRFFERIEAPIVEAEEALGMFDRRLIEQVFEVKEVAFNSAILKKKVLKELKKRSIAIHTKELAQAVSKRNGSIIVKTDQATYATKYVLNTTYSSINAINVASHLPVIPFKHELAEMCLVSLPPEMRDMAITIMCGPFFSLMPFPDKEGLYTLSHVRYTPHSEWHDTEDQVKNSHAYLDNIAKISHFPQMIADVKRFMPEYGNKIEFSGESIWEVKTVLPQSEGDDSRPILYKEHHGGLVNYICIMGGKIDNIYDVFKELKATYAEKTA